jgi:hypothetical protein
VTFVDAVRYSEPLAASALAACRARMHLIIGRSTFGRTDSTGQRDLCKNCRHSSA